VRITVAGDAVEVVVTNDGVRSTPAHHEPAGRGGYGIPGLRERAAHVGGTLEAGPAADGRWVVRASLPLQVSTPVIEEPAL
jgi:signal transduction histidine kinase